MFSEPNASSFTGDTEDGEVLLTRSFASDLWTGWLARVEVKTLYIEPGSPWENGYIENFNGKLRDELLNGDLRQQSSNRA